MNTQPDTSRANHSRRWLPCQIFLIGALLVGTAQAQLLQPSSTDLTKDGFSLASLLIEGPDLHPAVKTEQPGQVRNLPSGIDFSLNPHISTDPEFVQGTARGGSQGRLDATGMQAALYARYTDGGSDIGFYGLTAVNETVASEREQALRDIWSHNNKLDRTHVYRRGEVLLVLWIWTPDELPASWSAVKQWAAQTMAPGSPH